jgi:L-ascorbate metabolism protein UlaG (beta-lactamase superfamily)
MARPEKLEHPVTIIQPQRPSLAVLALAALLAAGGTALADETIPTDSGDLVIHPIHHAAMTLTWKDTTILVDPAPLGKGSDPAADFRSLPAPQIILVTHEHGDHFNPDVLSAVAGTAPIVAPKDVADKLPDALKGQAKVLANGDATEIDGIRIEAVPAYNTTADRLKFHPKERGDNGYVLTIGGKRIYIAGDTEDTPEMRALTDIDVAFLPMNLPYTMSIEQAADAVKAFKPKIVIPYHYGDSDVNAFKAAVGDAADVRLLAWYPAK